MNRFEREHKLVGIKTFQKIVISFFMCRYDDIIYQFSAMCGRFLFVLSLFVLFGVDFLLNSSIRWCEKGLMTTIEPSFYNILV